MSKLLDLARELVALLEENENKVRLGRLQAGDIFLLGPWEFVVLDNDTICGSVKAISRKSVGHGISFGIGRNYKKSDVKEYIESDIQPVIEQSAGGM